MTELNTSEFAAVAYMFDGVTEKMRLQAEWDNFYGQPAPAKRTRLMGGEDRPALLAQVITYNALADQARAMKIKGLSAKRLGRQASPTFRSLEIGEGWLALIRAEIAANTH
jgi:hypothetical protein